MIFDVGLMPGPTLKCRRPQLKLFMKMRTDYFNLPWMIIYTINIGLKTKFTFILVIISSIIVIDIIIGMLIS